MVRKGRVLRVGEGTYALPDAPTDLVTAARLRGRLTCCSVAKRHGLLLLHPPERPHVAVPRNRSGKSPLAVLHRHDCKDQAPWVPLLPALITLLRCLPLVPAVVVIDSALRTGAVTAAQLTRRLRGPGSVQARIALNAADRRSGSVIETVVRLALRQAGLPVVPQAWIPGVGRVDFLVGARLVVEVDGFEFHSARAEYRADRRRANALAAGGYVLLRFTYEDVLSRLDEVVAQVAGVYATL